MSEETFEPLGETSLFVYGTLRKGGSNHYLIEDAPLLHSRAHIDKFVMYSMDDGFPVVVRQDPKKVYVDWHPVRGEIYQLDPVHFQLTDHLEAHPHLFRRELVYASVDTENKKWEKCWVYLYQKDIRGLELVKEGDWMNYLVKKEFAEAMDV